MSSFDGRTGTYAWASHRRYETLHLTFGCNKDGEQLMKLFSEDHKRTKYIK